MIRTAVVSGQKLSSSCLEYALKRNLLETAEYMIKEYYPTTAIDTEVIIRQVIDEVDRGHNYLLYQALKKSRGHTWPKPKELVAYVA